MDRLNKYAGKLYFLLLALMLGTALFNLFNKLGMFPIYSWDEARHGVSAFEMLKNHNYIVNTYRYTPDYWNLKPPMSFWAIMAGFKIAGFNAFGFRLFSAIFAIITIIMIVAFTYKKFGKIASLVATLVLLTCTQYITNHCARTGDADSLFVFLFSIAVISIMLWNKNNIWLYISGLAFSLAFLTKSWHAGNIAIIIGLYLFLTGRYKKLTVKSIMVLLLSIVLPILIWGIFRYHYDGLNFFKGMIMYDLLQRSSTSIEGHVGGVYYYFSVLYRFFIFWIIVLCLQITQLIIKKEFSLKKLLSCPKKDYIIGICLWILVPFILFTSAKTKIRWYIIPIYPPLSILIGILASKLLLKGKWITRIILILAILVVGIFYESKIIYYLNHPISDSKQALIDTSTNMKNVKNDDLYIYHPFGKAVWSQSDVLSAEIADDFHVENGNFNDYLKNNKALLMIPKKLYNQPFMQSNHLKIISFNKWGFIVKKTMQHKESSPIGEP